MEPPVNTVPDSPLVQTPAARVTAQQGVVPGSARAADPRITPHNLPQTPPQASNMMQISLVAESDESTIGQEWIEKAKEIIARTEDDPYTQNKLLVQLRSQYLSTRFGKETMKADEE